MCCPPRCLQGPNLRRSFSVHGWLIPVQQVNANCSVAQRDQRVRRGVPLHVFSRQMIQTMRRPTSPCEDRRRGRPRFLSLILPTQLPTFAVEWPRRSNHGNHSCGDQEARRRCLPATRALLAFIALSMISKQTLNRLRKNHLGRTLPLMPLAPWCSNDHRAHIWRTRRILWATPRRSVYQTEAPPLRQVAFGELAQFRACYPNLV